MEALPGYILAAIVLFFVLVDRLLGKAIPKSRFPVCLTCGRTCQGRPLQSGVVMPKRIRNYLKLHGLPESIVSRYVCPRGHVLIWYAPRVGEALKGAMVAQRL
jgi:hypothetical protein